MVHVTHNIGEVGRKKEGKRREQCWEGDWERGGKEDEKRMKRGGKQEGNSRVGPPPSFTFKMHCSFAFIF